MKCDWCSSILPDEGFVCAHCGHDNAVPKDGEIVSSAQVRQTAPLNKPEATLIPFPNASGSSEKNTRTSEAPAWRDQIRESVRLYREQRGAVTEAVIEEVVAPDEEPEDPPPAIVEAALKRLRRPVSTIAEATSRQALKSKTPEETATPFDEENPYFSTAKLVAHPKTERSPAPSISTARTNPAPPIRLSAEPATVKHEARPATGSLASSPAQPAKLGDRALAWIFDLAVIVAASVPFFAIHSIIQVETIDSMAYTALAIVIWVGFIYQLWTLLVARRTCGMAWRNLKVVDAETNDLTFPEWRIFARSLAATVGLLVLPLNLLVIWSSGSQAGFADVLSRTRVRSFSKATNLNLPAKS